MLLLLFAELNDPLKTFLSGADIVGSANGIVCVSEYQTDEMFLFNPSTRKDRKIPNAPSEILTSIDLFNFGFGYDYVNGDYKVLKMAESDVEFGNIIAILYSIHTDKWTWIQNIPSYNISYSSDSGRCGKGYP